MEKKIDANLCNVAKGPGGHHGSKLRAELARQARSCLCWATTISRPTAATSGNSSLPAIGHSGKKYGVEYAEAFHYVGPLAAGGGSGSRGYLRQANAVPLK